MKRLGADLRQGRGGNVALVTALLAPLVIIAVGGAVDVTNASMRQSQLQAAADAAAIAAVARNSPAYADALVMPNSSTTTPITDPAVSQQAQAVFNADLQNTHDTPPNFNISVSKTGTTVSAVVTASSNYQDAIMGLFGRSTIALSVTSNASDNIPAYMNFYMLLDNTPSMGIGATDADISNIIAATNNGNKNFGSSGCAFACHSTVASWDAYDVVKNYSKNNNIPINMRIDVVREATQQLTQTAQNTEQTNGIQNEFQMAVYDFGTAALSSYQLHQDSSLSSDLTGAVSNGANSVALMLTASNNDAFSSVGPPPSGSVTNSDEDTSFDYTMSKLGGIMLPSGTTAGNGSTAQAPIPILFMVTDGMVDQNTSGGGNCDSSSRYCGAINPATCTALKNMGIKIAILYTTYVPNSLNDSWSQSFVAPQLSQIQPALQNCSSGSGYFQAVSPSDGISEAMAKLFQSVVAQVRITG